MQAFSNTPATETEVMESLMTKEGAGDRGWNLARQVYLFRTRIYNVSEGMPHLLTKKHLEVIGELDRQVHQS